jgi:hypothetical protein
VKDFISGSKQAFSFLALFVLIGCQTPQPSQYVGEFSPQIFSDGRRSYYFVKYVFNPNFNRIETRFVGDNESIGFRSSPLYGQKGEWSTLAWRIGRSPYVVLLAKWKMDKENLQIEYLCSDPFVEVRSLRLAPKGLPKLTFHSKDFQWRPYVDGEGQGFWRNY